MMKVLAAILTAVFANNCIFSGYFGIVPMFALPAKKCVRFAVSAFSAVLLILTAVCTYFIGGLAPDMAFLPYVAAIVLSVIFGLIGDKLMKGMSKAYAGNSEANLIMAVLNSAIIGISVSAAGAESFTDALFAAVGAGIGLVLATVIYGELRASMNDKFAPKAFQGLPLDFLTACLMSMAFLALA